MGAIAQGISDIGYGEGTNAGMQARLGIMKWMTEDNARKAELAQRAQAAAASQAAASQARSDQAAASQNADSKAFDSRVAAADAALTAKTNSVNAQSIASHQAGLSQEKAVSDAAFGGTSSAVPQGAEGILNKIIPLNDALHKAASSGNKSSVISAIDGLVKVNSDVADSMDARTAALAFTANGLFPGNKFAPEQISWVPNTKSGKLDMVVKDKTGAVLQTVASKHDASKPDSTKLEMNEVATAFGTPALDRKGKPVVDIMSGRQVTNRNIDEENKFIAWMDRNGYKDSNVALVKYKAMLQNGNGSTDMPQVDIPQREVQKPIAVNGIRSFVDTNGNITSGTGNTNAALMAKAGSAFATPTNSAANTYTETKGGSIKPSESARNALIAQAEAAIQQGKDPSLVKQRLVEELARRKL